MSVRWIYKKNPNPNGGCLCFRDNNPDQPGDGWGFHQPSRLLDGPGDQSPHVFRCEGCACDDPIADPRPDVVDSTAEEVADDDVMPVKAQPLSEDAPAKRKAAPGKK